MEEGTNGEEEKVSSLNFSNYENYEVAKAVADRIRKALAERIIEAVARTVFYRGLRAGPPKEAFAAAIWQKRPFAGVFAQLEAAINPLETLNVPENSFSQDRPNYIPAGAEASTLTSTSGHSSEVAPYPTPSGPQFRTCYRCHQPGHL